MAYPLIADFSKISKSGYWTQNRYTLKQHNLNDIDTEIIQFALNLPLDIDKNELYLRELNNIAVNERISYNEFNQAIKTLEYNDYGKAMLNKEWHNLYLSKNKLAKPNTLFKKTAFQHFKINNWHFYLLKKPIVNKNREVLISIKDLPLSMQHDKPLNEIKDFNELLERAKHLEKKCSDLSSCLKTIKDISGKMPDENFRIRQTLDKQTNKERKIEEYLQTAFSSYLKTPSLRIKLINALTDPKNRSHVNQITKNSLDNLLMLINILSKNQ